MEVRIKIMLSKMFALLSENSRVVSSHSFCVAAKLETGFSCMEGN